MDKAVRNETEGELRKEGGKNIIFDSDYLHFFLLTTMSLADGDSDVVVLKEDDGVLVLGGSGRRRRRRGNHGGGR